MTDDTTLEEGCIWFLFSIINERDIVGVEANEGRAHNAKRVIQDLS